MARFEENDVVYVMRVPHKSVLEHCGVKRGMRGTIVLVHKKVGLTQMYEVEIPELIKSSVVMMPETLLDSKEEGNHKKYSQHANNNKSI